MGNFARKLRRAAGDTAAAAWGKWEDLTHRIPEAEAQGLRTYPNLLRVFTNDVYVVQLFGEADGIVRLLVRCRAVAPVRSWVDLQRIKNDLVGPDRVAFEVYPQAGCSVDQAHVYHLWVLPKGAALPLDLGTPAARAVV